MSEITSWEINGAEGKPIIGNTHMPSSPVGTIVICHGFKGYKDYGFFPKLAESAASNGLIAHRFNFSHSGMTNNIETFENPELFESDTWNKQISDLSNVIKAIAEGKLQGQGLPLTIFGHSRGGVTTILTTSRLQKKPSSPLGNTIKGIITAASPDTGFWLNKDQVKELKKKGRLLSPSARTGQDLYVGLEMLTEMEHKPKAFEATRAIKNITCPICIIHGNDDPTVPVSSAHKLAEAAGDNAVRIIIPEANHVFNAPNPLPIEKTASPHTQVFLDQVCRFAVNICEKHD